MIIKFSNLGTIKETELDLRPLTVIIGPNNSNKTYIAYSVYGLWAFFERYVISPEPSFTEQTENLISIRVDRDFITLINNLIIRKTVQGFRKRLEEFFQDTSGRLFVNTNYELSISEEEVISSLRSLVGPKSMEPKSIEIDEGYSVSYQISLDRDVLHLQFNGTPPVTQVVRLEALYSLLISLRNRLFPPPVLLPAERNAFITTYRILSNRRYRLLRETQRGAFNRNNPQRERQLELLREQGDIRYPRPIEDFLDFLTDIELLPDTRINSDQKNNFQALADKIEEHIQNKNKTVLASTKLGGREIRVNVKKGLSIDLYNASSSIKQLAPLLLYLRYRAAENDLLIIDEPEMGLHPESQAKLLEALAILVNLGVKVLLTTHSPYFIAHLNNLLNGELEDARILKKQASHLYMKDTRAFLHEDQVSAYEMQDHKGKGYKLCSLKDDFENFGVRWGSLSDVSADLQQKFFEISEEKETVPHG